METQIMCFTCGTHIGRKIEIVKRYGEYPLFLSPQDALDKSQVKKECCRMTVMAQSGVEERVRAAGYPVTGDTGVMTVRISEGLEYPTTEALRKPMILSESPIKFAENMGTANWSFYSGPKSGMILQKHAVKGTHYYEKPKAPARGTVPESFSEIFIPGWDITNPDSYPKTEWMNVLRPEDKVIFIPIAPFSDLMVKFEPKRVANEKRPQVNSVAALITDIAAFVNEYRKNLNEMLLKRVPAIVDNPDLILQIFHSPLSLRDAYGGKMDFRKLSKGPEPNSIVLEFDKMKNPDYHNVPKHSKFISRMENYIKDFTVSSLEEEDKLSLILSKGDTEIVLDFEAFEINAEQSETTDILLDMTVRSVVHSRLEKQIFMIVFSRDSTIAVLSVLGPVTGTKDGANLDIMYPFGDE
jgi:DNA-directed RNA polymerase subunit N (RpoN/RPB10)